MTEHETAYPVGPPRHHSGRGPVMEAYVETGAYELACSNCGAEPKSWCTHPDGTPRKVPCICRRPQVAS